MPDGRDARAVEVVPRIAELAAEEWDACAGPGNPFVSHAFLSALEESGSATADNGWLAQHLAVRDEDGRLACVAPLYLKDHSYGEYVFDWGWADAYERAGGRYYPKLQGAVPFTPVTGPRLLVRPDVATREHRRLLAAAMVQLAKQHSVSSIHVTFCREEEVPSFLDLGFLERRGLQYHWENAGYGCFDDFLASLASRKRKAIKKERQKVAEADIRMSALSGGDIKAHHWDLFDRFYRATADRKWGVPYLTRRFWGLLGERLAEQVVLVLAEHDGRIVAGALNLRGGDTLYGRNWGCAGHFRFLHFEACYYQAIEYAIDHGLKRVEAGAQGEHKIQRGYLPAETFSCHWIADPGFRDAVADYLQRERRAKDREGLILRDFTPYRRGED
jgi:predicted N-acyltransferase